MQKIIVKRLLPMLVLIFVLLISTSLAYAGTGFTIWKDAIGFWPNGIAVDSAGNVYVVDGDHHQIQKFDSNGAFIAQWGSSGSADGQFSEPAYMAVDSAGNVYVADRINHRIQKFDSNGAFIAKWGNSGSADGQFSFPYGIAVDSTVAYVYVVDTENKRIQKFDSNGAFIAQWGSSGSVAGQFSSPYGIAVDSEGNVYVADSNNHRIQKFNSAGVFIAQWGSYGSGDGQFSSPYGIAVDSAGNVYVVDRSNQRIQKFNSNGDFIAKWGIEGRDEGQFYYPNGITVDSAGSVYVADGNNRIQVYTLDTTAPIITPGTVNRNSHTEGTVKFTSSEVGEYYYAVVENDAAAPTIDTSGAGTACTTSETTITNPTGLTDGAKDIYIQVKDAVGNVSSALKVDIAAYVAPSSNTYTAPQTQEKVVVIVNGKEQDAGQEIKTTEDGKSTVTVKINNTVIESKIDEAIKNNKAGVDNIIQVLVKDTKSDFIKVELTGDIVKKLEENTFDVSVKRDNIEYIIPAEEFTISKVAENLGVLEKDLKDIKIEIQITNLDETVVAKYNEITKDNGAELVFPPISFEVVAKTTKADGTTQEIEISRFNDYVERVMEIPAGVDPSKITTGIVFNLDGTYSHVPTEVFQKDGKWYAKLNSMTNSTYSVIWNPITVKSVEKHWSKDAVNNMASRLVIFNPETFTPDKAITRADFAEYIVRALGLYREGSKHENKFKDVSANGDRALGILIANEYGIVAGYPDGTFRLDTLITREEAMAMYQRAMMVTKLVGTDPNRYQSYTDYKQVSSWAISNVKEVLSAHVFNGNTARTISPKSKLTYAEAAQAIKNLLVESKLINK